MTPALQRRLEALWGLERRHPKLGLDGTRALLAGLGHPETRFRSVHVAGTNGKGSVCALVERVLRAAGHRTGLYTSPHLLDFRERIRVDGEWASEDELLARLAAIEALPDAAGATFFEVATALAFDRFARSGVEWAVVEVGLGGRLDSTNVLAPAVCAITSIGLDHAEILGDTHTAIAAEKAGILKPGVPAVSAVEHDAASRDSTASAVRALSRWCEPSSRICSWKRPHGSHSTASRVPHSPVATTVAST
ncbi:MAG: bifunctional folylpolyglutamate synthase/dihydrofolate synthase, partial [bacterium]